MNLNITIFFLFSALYDARANEGLQKDEVCVVAHSYVPPISMNHPHIIKADNINIILWESTAHDLEIEPWSLVCKKICFDTAKIKTSDNAKEVTVSNNKDIRIDWVHSCR